MNQYCSFCGTRDTEGVELVPGPMVLICENCIEDSLFELARPTRDRIVSLARTGDDENGASIVTRVEVIDEKGRSYRNLDVKKLALDYQDNDRTLKVFINWEQSVKSEEA